MFTILSHFLIHIYHFFFLQARKSPLIIISALLLFFILALLLETYTLNTLLKLVKSTIHRYGNNKIRPADSETFYPQKILSDISLILSNLYSNIFSILNYIFLRILFTSHSIYNYLTNFYNDLFN